MVEFVKEFARRLEAPDPHWTVLEIENEGLHPLVRAGLLRRSGFLSEWACECKDAEQCSERPVRIKRVNENAAYEFFCPRSCSWRSVPSEEVELYVPDEDALLRRLCDVFGIRAEEPSRLSSGIVRLGFAAEAFAHNERHVFYVSSLERGFDETWQDLPAGHSHLLIIGAGDIPWRPEGDSKRQRTFRIDEVLEIDEDGCVRLKRKTILSRLGQAKLPKRTRNKKTTDFSMEQKATFLFEWVTTKILEVHGFMKQGDWARAKAVADTVSTQKKICKQVAELFPISESEISRMKGAENDDGSRRYSSLFQAIEIVTNHSLMRLLFDKPQQKPGWLVSFKPNAAKINRTLAGRDAPLLSTQTRQAENTSISSARTRDSAPRQRMVKGDDEMSPEERDEDDKTFIADLCGQMVDDDSSTKDGNWNEEYGRDDES